MKQVTKKMQTSTLAGLALALALPATAAQLGQDARAAIPKDVQQLIVVDYHAMQNSQAAMDLKARVLPPELKQLEQALRTSGLDENHDIEELAFASFRHGGETRIVGLAQGQFSLDDIMANFKKRKVKPIVYRDNRVYPMGQSGMQVVFLNPTTMVFGQTDALKSALDARDGLQPSFLNNSAMLSQMQSVDTDAVWSILDQEGTQTMMRSVLGDASQLTDYDTVKKRLLSSRYSMNFDNGVKIFARRDYTRHHLRRHHGLVVECRGSIQESEWYSFGEAGHRQHHHQLQRWHSGRALCFLRQPVFESPAVEPVSVRGPVIYFGLVRLGVQVTAPWASILTRSDP